MKTRCVKCGLEYQLTGDEDPKNFQCNCGGNLEERRTLSDYKEDNYEEKTNEYFKGDKTTHESKEDLFQRGYKLVDEDNESYTFNKKVPVMPVWLLVVIAILLFPIGTVIAVLLYFLWTKPKIKVVKKESI